MLNKAAVKPCRCKQGAKEKVTKKMKLFTHTHRRWGGKRTRTRTGVDNNYRAQDQNFSSRRDDTGLTATAEAPICVVNPGPFVMGSPSSFPTTSFA